jgi:hypothetical protein
LSAEELPELPVSQPFNVDFTNRPALAVVYKISGFVMFVLGPLFCAAILVLFL